MARDLESFTQQFIYGIESTLIEEFGDLGVITDDTIDALAYAVAYILQPYDIKFGEKTNFRENFIKKFHEAYKFYDEHPIESDDNENPNEK